ncbi:selenocysteine-specific translation elongation factor [Nannocystis sp. SCPEA4]|uniref:selenocysteine-specific translation elongation factor n=1 Tax=Nannocystis sp. SCPEA4 TaxID=2996787 RepID=UPI00227113CB|nr:selenocysteine-specific translation elongation factor [Nannocystis sp. SCPEA4]MCY1058421.1 selenocysteine-specific translation elongation factor [Nannocystis sp. SCPEA4]
MAKPVRDLVLGTAGHIDHGKTALVRALTGVDTDRLPEEKRRGITIDLGFAAWQVGPGLQASIVDVPGHEAFVRTMVAGAGGVDAVLLVVSAEEGVMPQTREHLLVCRLLGITHAVVALTKIDRLHGDAEAIALAEADVRAALADLAPALGSAAIVPCSAHSGAGLPELTAAVRRVAAQLPVRPLRDRPILPVDRCFVLKGHGTVVTGTLLSGQLEIAADPHFTLVPTGPDRPVRELRARALHVRGAAASRIPAGARAAVNLGGVAVSELARGDVLTRGHRVVAGDAVHALLEHLPHDPRTWRSGTSVQVCAGTAHTTGRLDPLGPLAGDEDAPKTMSLAPGTSALVRIRLDTPLPTWHGQRIVLRSHGGDLAHGHTCGGGVVVDPRPRPGRGQRSRWLRVARALAGAELRARLAALLADAGALAISRDELELRSGALDLDAVLSDMVQSSDAVRLGDSRHVAAAVLPELAAAAVTVADRFHAAHPDRPGLSRAALLGGLPGRVAPDVAAAALDHALRRGLLELRGDVLVRGGTEPTPGLSPVGHKVLDLYVRAGVAPPTLKEVQAAANLTERQALDALTALQKAGALVRVSADLSLAREHHAALVDKVRSHLGASPQIDVQTLKGLTGLSRKFVVPFLEHLDRLGLTRRQGEVRVAGPKLHAG